MPISWDAFTTRYGPMARAIARTLADPSTSPEDVVQEAFLSLHSALAREPGRFAETAHARNYFFRTVRNLALKSRRGAGRERSLAADPPAPDPADPAAEAVAERQRILARALLELDLESRALVARRFLESRTLADVAAETGVPVSTLHDRERAILRRLRELLTRIEREVAG
jgi:RNA polymerase sigma factor (sigma-70 family)